jgi:nitrous oxide reductase
MESVIRGKVTTIINYQTILPEYGKNDSLDLNVVDDQGNELSKSGIGPESATFNSKIDKDAKFLMIYPEFSKDEFHTIIPIGATPFKVESNRFGVWI